MPGPAKAALRSIYNGFYNGSKRAHILRTFCSKPSSQGTPTERSLAAPALGEARVSKKSPMVRDIGVMQKMHILFCPRSPRSSSGWWKDVFTNEFSPESRQGLSAFSLSGGIRLVGLKLHSSKLTARQAGRAQEHFA